MLRELLFPRRCPVCDEVLPLIQAELPQKVCPKCRKKLFYIGEPICKKCGKPLESERLEYCNDCIGKRHEFQEGRALLLYKGSIKETMYRFKYSGRREYAEFFGEEACRRYGGWIRRVGIELIVPVPMYKRKQRKRGYNQAEDFARELGEKLGILVDTKLVYRKKDTIPQKGLDEKERRENTQAL